MRLYDTSEGTDRNQLISEHFNQIANEYEAIHLRYIDGGIQSKIDTVKFVPDGAERILDLGVGTGLELEYIFDKNKNAEIDCVDISRAMLQKLKEKYKDKKINILCKDYFKHGFKKEKYDCALSIMSLHHFLSEEKEKIYRKVHNTLVGDGVFIYSDLFAASLKKELFHRERLMGASREYKSPLAGYDVPTYPQTDIGLLSKVGFVNVEKKWQIGSNACIVSQK